MYYWHPELTRPNCDPHYCLLFKLGNRQSWWESSRGGCWGLLEYQRICDRECTLRTGIRVKNLVVENCRWQLAPLQSFPRPAQKKAIMRIFATYSKLVDGTWSASKPSIKCRTSRSTGVTPNICSRLMSPRMRSTVSQKPKIKRTMKLSPWA